MYIKAILYRSLLYIYEMYLSMFAIDLFLYGCGIHYLVFPLLWEVKIGVVSVALHMPC